MKQIYCLGETLLDIIFKNNVAISSCPGGAMLNTSVSLGRAGKEIYLISEYGMDHAGDVITDFLKKNGVGTDFIYRYEEEQTGIALAFLNEENESRYSFYKNYPAKRLAIELPVFNANGLLLFGSFYSVEPVLRQKVKDILEEAKKAGSILLYDPNIRKPHEKDLPLIVDNIRENIGYADIIRGSHEDFQTIFDLNTADEVFNLIPSGKTIIYTHSYHGVWLRYKDQQDFYPGQRIDIKSTIGAGDSFNAGLMYGLSEIIHQREQLQHIHEKQWKKIIFTATAFAREVCKSYDNFISEEFIQKKT